MINLDIVNLDFEEVHFKIQYYTKSSITDKYE
jgi:hypothetical protein